jgi:hypothetical protein
MTDIIDFLVAGDLLESFVSAKKQLQIHYLQRRGEPMLAMLRQPLNIDIQILSRHTPR